MTSLNLLPITLLTLLLLHTAYSLDIERFLTTFLKEVNENFLRFNQMGAQIAWESSVDPDNPDLSAKAAAYQESRLEWQQDACDQLGALYKRFEFNETQKRQLYLLCRGPMFTYEEVRETSKLYDKLRSTYANAQICFQTEDLTSKSNLTRLEESILIFLTAVKRMISSQTNATIEIAAKVASKGHNGMSEGLLCLDGEDEVDRMMRFSKNEEVLRFLWLSWRDTVGPPLKEPFRKMVDIENRAAARNGYHDIGDSWRDEVEIPHLRVLSRYLYEDIKPLYKMLHGVVRFYLRRQYGDVIPQHGPIPAHLLGSLWSQNWEPLTELIFPRPVDLDASIASLNWTVQHMVKRAEDYYQSLGLPPMTEKFWRESVFARENSDIRCHGTAADMFQDGDYRLLYCSGVSMEDFYVVHHEMGHIQYYMAYQNQPGLYRQANSFLHESIGDTLMLGALAPQHLHRLGLINDSLLYRQVDDEEDDDRKDDPFNVDDGPTPWSYYRYHEPTILEILLLKSALNKLPHLPFALLIDEYRWRYFEGSLKPKALNKEFWDLARQYQGVDPPSERGEKNFDIAAKFHVPDNTPYIRYFLSGVLQYQLFETACAAAVFGRRDVTARAPPSVQLAACDLYGSKPSGRFLRDLMSRGHSQNWRDILSITTGKNDIATSSLKRYYRPLFKLLKRMIKSHRIPIGW